MRQESRIDLVLINEADEEVGISEKLEAHLKGLLHRAFSVMIYNPRGELLIQRRASTKYHSAGLWANTVCGHPYPGEPVWQAAKRRLDEELGFSCPIVPITHVKYFLRLRDGLFEHEYVHVFEGHVSQIDLSPNPEEVSEYTWMSPRDLREDVKRNPHLYARWFRLYLLKYYEPVFAQMNLPFLQAA